MAKTCWRFGKVRIEVERYDDGGAAVRWAWQDAQGWHGGVFTFPPEENENPAVTDPMIAIAALADSGVIGHEIPREVLPYTPRALTFGETVRLVKPGPCPPSPHGGWQNRRKSWSGGYLNALAARHGGR